MKAAFISGELELTLTQRGPKVIGDRRFWARRFRLEGTVSGDVFSFRDPDGRLSGEAIVSSDAMSGQGQTDESLPSVYVRPVQLQRVAVS